MARTIPSAPGVVLSFDDGPHPEGTPAVLEILDAAGAKAIFFLVGDQVRRYPELAARISAAGHAVGLHADRHQLQLRLGRAAVEADLARGTAVIADAAGVAPAWHRPPYGIYTAAGLSAAHAAGLRSLLWSRWGKDWRKFTTPGRIAARATRDIRSGDVILLHDADFYNARDSHQRTVQALPEIISALNRCGHATVLPV